jgi:nitrate reductase NapD
MNICSCVIHAHPGSGAEVAARLTALPGVEVHAGSEVDKLVVTIEDTDEALAPDTLGTLTRVAGVINAVLVYHYGGDDISAAAH